MASIARVPESFGGGFVRGRELGRGASGLVFASEKGSETFAVKAIDLRHLRLSVKADRELKKLQREVDILKRVPPHPNLVRFVDALEEGDWFFFVFEFVGGGDLFTALIQRPPEAGKRPSFREGEVIFICRQLVAGLSFLHENGVIHRDLKLENILVARAVVEDGNTLLDVKITDFGLSKVVGPGLSDPRSTVGSPRYIAPEVLAKGNHDFRADLWSLGILLFVLLAGYFPIDGLAKAAQPALDSTVAKLDVSSNAKFVISQLLVIERELRMPLHELRTHVWLTGEVAVNDMDEAPSKRPRLDSPSTLSLFGSEEFADEDIAKALATHAESECDDQAIVREIAVAPALCRLDMHPVVVTTPLVGTGNDVGDNEPVAKLQMRPPVSVPGRSKPKLVLGHVAAVPAGMGAEIDALPPEAKISSILELDANGHGDAVQGIISFRSDHKTGGGFHLRIRDGTGEIDVRFWEQAADQFRSDPALTRGTTVCFEGFHMLPLKEKDILYAPPGRRHHLNYNLAQNVRFHVVSGTCLNIARPDESTSEA